MAVNIIGGVKGSLGFSAVDLKAITDWPEPVIEDYLNLTRVIQQIADAVDGDFGTMALQDADDVVITGGSISNVTMDNVTIDNITINALDVTNLNVSGTSNLNIIEGSTFNLSDNTITGTMAEFNTALTDGNFAFVNVANTFADSQTIQGNLIFDGSARRILADLSNATSGNRLMIQNSVADSNSILRIMPNGTATTSAWQASNSSDTANNCQLHLTATSTFMGVFSNILGAGPLLPLYIGINNVAGIEISTTNHVTVNNNLTIGSSSADDLIINSDAWTLSNNYTATRAAGVAPAGLSLFGSWDTTFSGDAGGTTDGRSQVHITTVSGANSVAQAISLRQNLRLNATAGTVAAGVANSAAVGLQNAGAATLARVYNGQINVTGAGSITTGSIFAADSPSLTSTGAITTLIGYTSGNLGHATLVINSIGFQADNMTASATLTVSFRSQQNSGTGVWGFLHSGTANNSFFGNVSIGTNTAPTRVLSLKAGSSTTLAQAGGVIADFIADVSVGGAEADIFTTTTAASILAVNGDKIVASYGGNFVTVGTELTQLKVYFAGTAIWDSTALAPATGTTSWRVIVEIIRVSSTVIRYTVSLNTSGATGYTYCTSGELTGLTLSGTNILKVTGTSSGVGSAVGDIVGKMGFVSWSSAA